MDIPNNKILTQSFLFLRTVYLQLWQISVLIISEFIFFLIKHSQQRMDNLKSKDAYTIRWNMVNLIEPKTNKYLLTDCSGAVSSGQFLSIMGPSGAGKSSLLSVLTARLSAKNSKLNLDGEILLNDATYNLHKFSKLAAYVQQDDLLFGTLTVRETFYFQCQLKLWRSSPEQQKELCEQILKKLNLVQCADTLIGNSQFKKCISGGQKKRVSIGVELISNPEILIFDEPTSGLDSHNALIIVKLLYKLAKQENKLIITTIHQPSTLMFQKMDRLYLLRTGQCIYDGPANEIVSYMERLNIKIDYRMNPADFYMLQISALKEESGYKTPLNIQNFIKHRGKDIYQRKESNSSEIALQEEVPFSYQFKPLCDRAFKNFYRLPSNQLNKLVTAVMIPAMLGILYYKIADNAPSTLQARYLSDLISFLFMGIYFIFAMNIYDTVMIFPNEKELVFKQAGANLYSMPAYYISRLIAQIGGCLLPGLICAIVLYFTAGLQITFSHFFVFVGIYVIMALQGYFFGIFFGVLCKNEQSAINLLPMVLIPIIIFGGLVVNLNDIPAYISWVQYISPLRHSFMIIFQDVLNSSKLQQLLPYNIPQKYGIDGDPLESLGFLLGLLVLYFLLSILLLTYLMRKRM